MTSWRAPSLTAARLATVVCQKPQPTPTVTSFRGASIPPQVVVRHDCVHQIRLPTSRAIPSAFNIGETSGKTQPNRRSSSPIPTLRQREARKPSPKEAEENRMNVDTVADFLADQRDEAPEELQHLVLQFEDYWERKLWHQLTDSLIEFFNHPGSGDQRLDFYRNFISKFADKINQLKLVDLGLKAATQCRDDQECLTFLSDLAKKVDNETSQDAHVYAIAALARINLKLRDLEASRANLDKAERILDSFDSVETKVHAAFYRVNASYYQAQSDFASYYRNALLYLACIELSTLSDNERRSRAYDLGIAALVSDSIYNFGELLQHPILAALTGDVAWLRELLVAFNRGDLAAYDVLSGHIDSNPLLKEHHGEIRQKIYLAALTESVFRRPPHQRAMTFDDISDDTKVHEDEIEHLVMKALSLGLVRGTIDEVDELVNFTWVQPRVLDMTQIASMNQRLGEWGENVNKLGNWIETTGQDIWAP